MNPIFEVERNGAKIRLPLTAMTANEILAVANGLLREGRKREAQPLYHLQHALRNERQPPLDAA